MRNPRLTSKRLLSAFLVAGLAATAVVSLATSSDAATVPAMTLTPSSGATVGGDTLQIKGKGLADANTDSLVKSVVFSTAACAAGDPATLAGHVFLGTNAAAITVTSATTATLIIPTVTLPAGSGFICLFDSQSGTAGNVLGSAKYTVGVKPVITTINGIGDATVTAVSASTFGGTTLTFVGTGFTKATYVSVGGTKAKTTYSSATSITASIPTGIAGTGKAIKVTSEFGSVTSAGNTVTYLGVVKVSPVSGVATAGVGITLTGTGFNALTFDSGVATNGGADVVFVPGGATPLAAAAAVPTLVCTSVVVQSDTSLTCRTPALAGAYSAQIVVRDTTTNTNIGTGGVITVVSRLGTFTGAAF